MSTTYDSGQVGDAIAAIEQELAALWAPDEHAPPKARASIANLVLLTSAAKRQATLELTTTLDVAQLARTFVISIEPKLPPWGIETSVSSHCYRHEEGLICADRIELTVGSAAAARAASIVAALSVREVSTVVVATEQVPPLLLAPLAKAADRLILDTENLGMDESQSLLKELSAHVVDLGWKRLTPWRALLARGFDLDDLPPFATSYPAIHRVNVTTAPMQQNDEKPSYNAQLMLGWLASRLGWHLLSSESALDSQQAPIDITMQTQAAGHLPSGGLWHMDIEGKFGDIPMRIALDRSTSTPDVVHLSRSGPGLPSLSQTTPLAQTQRAALVDQAIHDRTSDKVFRQALDAAAVFRSSLPGKAGRKSGRSVTA